MTQQNTEKERQLEGGEHRLQDRNDKQETCRKDLQDQQNQVEKLKVQLKKRESELEERNQRLIERDKQLEEKDQQLEQKKKLLQEIDKLMGGKDEELMERKKEIEEKDKQLEEKKKLLEERTRQLELSRCLGLDGDNENTQLAQQISDLNAEVETLRIRLSIQQTVTGDTTDAYSTQPMRRRKSMSWIPTHKSEEMDETGPKLPIRKRHSMEPPPTLSVVNKDPDTILPLWRRKSMPWISSQKNFKLITDSAVKGVLGEDIILSCRLSPETSAVSATIRWFKGTECIYLYKNGQMMEGSGYEDRLSLTNQELESGNVSLMLRSYGRNDEGYYICQVIHGDQLEEATVGLDYYRFSTVFTKVGAEWYLMKETGNDKQKRSESALQLETTLVKQERTIQLEEMNETLRGCVNELQERISILEDELQDSEKTLEKTTQELEEEIRVLQDKETQLIQQNETQLQNSMEESKRQLDEINQRYAEKEIQLDEMTQGNTEKEIQLYEMTQQNIEKDIQLCEMTQQNREKERQLVEMTQQNTEKEKQLDEMTQQNTEKERQLEEGEKTLLERDDKLKTCRKDLLNQSNQVEKLKVELKERESEIEERNQRLMERDISISSLIEEKNKLLEEKDKQLEGKDEELMEKKRELEEKDQQVEEKKKVVEERNGQLEEKDKQLEEKDTQLEEKDKQLEKRDKQLEKKDKELMERKEGLKDVKTENAELAQQICGLKTEVETLRIRLSAQQTESAEISETGGHDTELPPSLSGETTDADSILPLRRKSMPLISSHMGGDGIRPDSPVSPRVSELRLVLLGRTGAGRSAAGNTILGREEFGFQASPPVLSRRREGEVCGRWLVLVDTPDCPGLSLEDMRQNVGCCVRLSAPGPHAFLLVLPVESSEEEERGMIERMEEMFGEGCWGHTVILFTHTDRLREQSMEESLKAGSQELQQLVEKCRNRYHVLNIKDRSRGDQVSELLDKIEEMVSGNTESFYNTQTYQEAEAQIKEMEKRIQKEREERKQREEDEIRKRLEKELQDSLTEKEGEIQGLNEDIRILNERILVLEKELEEERDEKKKSELEIKLQAEISRQEEINKDLDLLREQSENKKMEMEKKYEREQTELRERFEKEAMVEAEVQVMKIVFPALQKASREIDLRARELERINGEREIMNRKIESLGQRMMDMCGKIVDELMEPV